jgi:S-(hydroxymethyl)glutathione dehydrogenase / alcohol dehydrogenase
MRAAVAYGVHRPLDVVDVSLRGLGAKDVLVRIEASGVCHSDVSVQTGALRFPTPVILGHEGAGVVEEVGSDVTLVKPGDHAVLSASLSCGLCRPCQRGRPNLCEWGLPTIFGCKHPDGEFRAGDSAGVDLFQFACVGSLAERTIVPEVAVVPIAQDVPFEAAALVGCGVLTGLGAVFNRARVEPGASVAVIGCGGVGLNVVQGARLAGATLIAAVDPVSAKRDLADSFGATHAIDPNADDVIERIVELTGGRGADHVFECVGKGELVRMAWDACAMWGTVVAIGVAATEDVAQLPAQSFSTSEKTLMSCLYGTSRPRIDMPVYVELYRQGKIKLDELITTRYSLENVNDAVADLESGRNARGVVVMAP